MHGFGKIPICNLFTVYWAVAKEQTRLQVIKVLLCILDISYSTSICTHDTSVPKNQVNLVKITQE